jgi:hypothetical protein
MAFIIGRGVVVDRRLAWISFFDLVLIFSAKRVQVTSLHVPGVSSALPLALVMALWLPPCLENLSVISS